MSRARCPSASPNGRPPSSFCLTCRQVRQQPGGLVLITAVAPRWPGGWPANAPVVVPGRGGCPGPGCRVGCGAGISGDAERVEVKPRPVIREAGPDQAICAGPPTLTAQESGEPIRQGDCVSTSRHEASSRAITVDVVNGARL